MASIAGFQGNVTGTTGATNVLEPKASYRVYILPRGAEASAASSGSVITFDSVSAAARFTANHWIQVGTDGANVRQVTGVGGGSIGVNGAVTVALSQHVFNIGSTQPTISGSSATYQPNTTIFPRSDDGATPVTNSLLTTDANGLFQFWASDNHYDGLVQDANVSNVGGLVDLIVGLSTSNTGTFGQTLTVNAGLTLSGRLTVGQTTVITGGVSIGQDLRVAYDVVSKASGQAWIASRFGGRAQTTGDNRTLVYASETFTNDLTDGTFDETVAVYGINQIAGNVAAGADCWALQGGLQYIPSAAKTATGQLGGIQCEARMASTHASAIAAFMVGGAFRFITSTGSTGTVTIARGVNITQPSQQGTVEVGQYIGLFVQGASSGFATTQNHVANFSSGDDNTSFFITGSPVRWQDSFNQANSAVAGRMFDINKTIVGASQLTTLYAPVHLNADLRGAFVAGDDVHGYRSLVRTNTTSGDGANLDIMSGYRADMDHRSNATVDEVYGFDSSVNHSTGSGVITTLAGIRSVVAPTAGQTTTNVLGAVLTISGATPSAAHGNIGHILFTPISMTTPATGLAALTGAADGTMMYITDSNNATNSGFYFRINGAWQAITGGNSSLHTASDS